jgi:hypothetical protein
VSKLIVGPLGDKAYIRSESAPVPRVGGSGIKRDVAQGDGRSACGRRKRSGASRVRKPQELKGRGVDAHTHSVERGKLSGNHTDGRIVPLVLSTCFVLAAASPALKQAASRPKPH